MSSLAINALNAKQDSLDPHKASSSTDSGPFILSCSYCNWSTLDVGIKFDKHTNIGAQLGIVPSTSLPAPLETPQSPLRNESTEEDIFPKRPSEPFAALAAFYKSQLNETNPSGPFGVNHNFGLDSPSQLSRLLSTFGVSGLRKSHGKVPIMREANENEGLQIHNFTSDAESITKLHYLGLEGTITTAQRDWQAPNARFQTDLRPVPTLLRSKRARRCRTCKNMLVRPEEKRQSARFKIRLMAANTLPTISIKPFPGAVVETLASGKTMQYVLSFRNPLFDPVKVTLATPPVTPGKVGTKVTILCPQFELGANADIWDEALETGKKVKDITAAEGQVAEAGKVWEQGRNWTSVVLEVVPGSLKADVEWDSGDEVIAIPIFVRLDYDTDDTSILDTDSSGKNKRVHREHAYWSVISIGSIPI